MKTSTRFGITTIGFISLQKDSMNANQFKHHPVVDLPAISKGGTNTTNSAKPFLKKRVEVLGLLIVLLLMMQAACAPAVTTTATTDITAGQSSQPPPTKPSSGPTPPPDFYLLPSVGGVGVERQLQMVLVSMAGQTPEITWRSSNPEVATVNKFGEVTGLELGTTTIAGIVDQVVYTSTITVGEPVASVSAVEQTGKPGVVPIQTEISVPCYCTRAVSVLIQGAHGNLLNDRLVTWTSEKPLEIALPGGGTVQGDEIASVPIPQLAGSIWAGMSPSDSLTAADDWFFHRTAEVIGHRDGTTSITATSEGISFVIQVVVTPNEPTSLIINPESMQLDFLETQQATATGRTAEGCTAKDPPVTWQSADPTIAEVDARTGDVLGNWGGTTELTAVTPNGVSASIVVNVNRAPISSINIEPSPISAMEVGAIKGLTAILLSETGRPLDNSVVTWSVSGNAVTLEPDEKHSDHASVTGQAAGSAVVTAMSEGVSTSAEVFVVNTQYASIDLETFSIVHGNDPLGRLCKVFSVN